MSRADRKELARYVRWIANEIGLRDWTLTLHYQNNDEDALATTTPTWGRKQAEIRFCADFRTLKPDAQRHTVIHELLHCHFAAAQDAVRLDLLKHIGQQSYDLFWEHYRQAQEYGIDGVTDGVAGGFPLIQWPKKKAA